MFGWEMNAEEQIPYLVIVPSIRVVLLADQFWKNDWELEDFSDTSITELSPA